MGVNGCAILPMKGIFGGSRSKSEAQCIKYPIKSGHREALVNWIAHLGNRTTELVEAMAEGRLAAEGVFLEKAESGDHLLIYTRAKDVEAAMEALSKSELQLVQEFDQLMVGSVDLENAVTLQLIYHTP